MGLNFVIGDYSVVWLDLNVLVTVGAKSSRDNIASMRCLSGEGPLRLRGHIMRQTTSHSTRGVVFHYFHTFHYPGCLGSVLRSLDMPSAPMPLQKTAR